MATKTATIGSKVGLHARPAAMFVQAVTATGLPVTIAKEGGDPVDARSLLAVMAQSFSYGTEVTLSAEGDGAEEKLEELANMLDSDLDEA
ncbi:MAG: HPr family phosphocarrier protein [Micrococcaceae bacterium]